MAVQRTLMGFAIGASRRSATLTAGIGPANKPKGSS